MRRRIGKPSIPQLLVYVVLIGGIVVGAILGHGTGDTILAISGALLALWILGTVGLGEAANNAYRGGRRGRGPNRWD